MKKKYIKKLHYLVINVTCNTSIELHSHRDVSVPSPWMYSDITRYYSREQTILNNRILISVSCEILREKHEGFLVSGVQGCKQVNVV